MRAPDAPATRTKLFELAGQSSRDPRAFLRELGALQGRALAANWDMDLEEKVKLVTLRRGIHKPIRELRAACIFACLFEQVLNARETPTARVRVAPPNQDRGTDVYLLWEDAVGQRFSPIQLKELPPGHLNPKASLGELFDKLRKYPPSEMMPIVAVLMNRDMHLEDLTVPAGLNVASLWLYGAVTPDSMRWGLLGDLLSGDTYRNLPLGL